MEDPSFSLPALSHFSYCSLLERMLRSQGAQPAGRSNGVSKPRNSSPKHKKKEQPPQAETLVVNMCERFSAACLSKVEPDVDAVCHGAIRSSYLGEAEQKKLETVLERVYNFLASLETALKHPKGEAQVTAKLPPRPKIEFSAPPGLTAEEKARAAELMQRIKEAKDKYKQERAEIGKLRKELRQFLDHAEAQRQRVQAKLGKVKPALDKAIAGLAAIKEEHLVEVRSYTTPPPMVGRVLESVMTVLGEKKAGEWDIICSYVRRRDFIPMVRDFQPSSVTESARKRISKMASDPTFTYENAHKASRAAAPLLQWVLAMCEYADALVSVKPLQDELAKLDADIALFQAELDRRTKASGMQEIKAMQAEYEDKYGDTELARRAAEQRRQDEEREFALREQWERECREAERIAAEENEKRRPPAPLGYMEYHPGVKDVRRRCNILIKAITATMDVLNAHNQSTRPLVVQRGRWSTPTTAGVANASPHRRRPDSPSPQPSFRHSPMRTGRATSVSQLDQGFRSPSTARRLMEKQERAQAKLRWVDPHHRGLELDCSAATSRLLMVGTNEAYPRTKPDGTVESC